MTNLARLAASAAGCSRMMVVWVGGAGRGPLRTPPRREQLGEDLMKMDRAGARRAAVENEGFASN